MIQNLTSYLNYSLFAELPLILFALIFVAVVIRTLMTRGEITVAQSRIVLGETNDEQ